MLHSALCCPCSTMTSLPSIAHLLCSDLDTLPPLTTSMQMVFDPKLFDYQVRNSIA